MRFLAAFLLVTHLAVGYIFHSRITPQLVRRTASRRSARLTMETIAVPRQQNPNEYERLVRETVAATDNVVRWYIASFQNASAIIEAVVETP